MRKTLFLIFALSLPLRADTEAPAVFKGYTAINRVLKERIAAGTFELGKYVGEYLASPNPNTLVELLGTYEGTDTGAAFRNGNANPINMTLWYLLFSRLGADIGQLCTHPSIIPTQEAFRLALAPLCAWPDLSAQSENVLKAYWNQVMGFDAPDGEYQAWKAFAVASYRDRPAADAIAGMTVWMLMNPYFLLGD